MEKQSLEREKNKRIQLGDKTVFKNYAIVISHVQITTDNSIRSVIAHCRSKLGY